MNKLNNLSELKQGPCIQRSLLVAADTFLSKVDTDTVSNGSCRIIGRDCLATCIRDWQPKADDPETRLLLTEPEKSLDNTLEHLKELCKSCKDSLGTSRLKNEFILQDLYDDECLPFLRQLNVMVVRLRAIRTIFLNYSQMHHYCEDLSGPFIAGKDIMFMETCGNELNRLSRLIVGSLYQSSSDDRYHEYLKDTEKNSERNPVQDCIGYIEKFLEIITENINLLDEGSWAIASNKLSDQVSKTHKNLVDPWSSITGTIEKLYEKMGLTIHFVASTDDDNSQQIPSILSSNEVGVHGNNAIYSQKAFFQWTQYNADNVVKLITDTDLHIETYLKEIVDFLEPICRLHDNYITATLHHSRITALGKRYAYSDITTKLKLKHDMDCLNNFARSFRFMSITYKLLHKLRSILDFCREEKCNIHFSIITMLAMQRTYMAHYMEDPCTQSFFPSSPKNCDIDCVTTDICSNSRYEKYSQQLEEIMEKSSEEILSIDFGQCKIGLKKLDAEKFKNNEKGAVLMVKASESMMIPDDILSGWIQILKKPDQSEDTKRCYIFLIYARSYLCQRVVRGAAHNTLTILYALSKLSTIDLKMAPYSMPDLVLCTLLFKLSQDGGDDAKSEIIKTISTQEYSVNITDMLKKMVSEFFTGIQDTLNAKMIA